MHLLLIPTIEPLHFGKECVESFHLSLVQTSTLAVVIYNGCDTNVTSDFSQPNIIKIGFEDSKRIAESFSEIIDCPEELIFGKQEYGRSYGGSSNLLLAIGHALGASVMGKIDDDCLQIESANKPWLCSARELSKHDKICFGPYAGHPSGFINDLPNETANSLAKHIYSKKADHVRSAIGTGEKGQSVKNGNLVIPRNALSLASYPVLYDPITRTHARGEVYYWMHELAQHGITFTYEKTLKINHRYSERNTAYTWLRSLVLAFDLSLVHRFRCKEKKSPDISVRHNAISKFKSWIFSAKWPEDVIAEDLASLLEQASFDFTETFYSNLPKRQSAWNRLVSANLDSVLRQVLPALIKFKKPKI